MKDQLEITTKDLQRLNAVIDRAHLSTVEPDLPFSVLGALGELVPCDISCQLSPDPSRRRILLDKNYFPGDGTTEIDDECDVSVPITEVEENYWTTAFTSMCCGFQYWTGDHTSVHRCTDWYPSERAYFNSEIGTLVKDNHRFSILMPLPTEGAIEHQVILFRVDGRNFSDREQMLLNLVRPHIAEIHLEQRRRRLSGGLTKRQVQLMALVAQGLTNRQIASRLGIAEGTVRTHLEHAFERLGVTSRTAAVTRLTDAGPRPAGTAP